MVTLTRKVSMLQEYKSRKDAAWFYLGWIQSSIADARKLLRKGRRREALRVLDTAAELRIEFEALDNPSRTTMAAGGLPAGDKDEAL